MEKRNGAGFLKWIFIILAVALVLFICHKAGWILNGQKNQVSEQEKREALKEVEEEIEPTTIDPGKVYPPADSIVKKSNGKTLDQVLHPERQVQKPREIRLKHESLELQKIDSTASRRHPKLDTLRKDKLYEILEKHKKRIAR